MTKARAFSIFAVMATIILGAYLLKAPVSTDLEPHQIANSIRSENSGNSEILPALGPSRASVIASENAEQGSSPLAFHLYPRTEFNQFAEGDSDIDSEAIREISTFQELEGTEDESPEVLPATYSPSDPVEAGPPMVHSNNSIQARLLSLSPSDVQIAGSHIHYGKTLARKGATYSARNEFVNALAVIAQSFDMQSANKEHSAALARGLKAITEADDFHGGMGGANIDTDVASIVEGHLSRVMTITEAGQLTRAQAMQAYYGYAHREILFACGTRNWLASEALYALGRLHGILGQASTGTQPREKAKAMVLHSLALATWPQNFASANDLGVLLAGNGNLDQARDLLAQSVAIHPHPEIWKNLANVHRQLGEMQLAELAIREAQLVETNALETERPDGLIRWVAASEFESAPLAQEAEPSIREASREPDSQSKSR